MSFLAMGLNVMASQPAKKLEQIIEKCESRTNEMISSYGPLRKEVYDKIKEQRGWNVPYESLQVFNTPSNPEEKEADRINQALEDDAEYKLKKEWLDRILLENANIAYDAKAALATARQNETNQRRLIYTAGSLALAAVAIAGIYTFIAWHKNKKQSDSAMDLVQINNPSEQQQSPIEPK